MNGLLGELIKATDEAGSVIMALYGKVDARQKDDRSPVTAADEAAEKVILAHLARLTPDIPVVAEEQASQGLAPESVGSRFWLVDPLDGTREFLSKNGEFTVNIALIGDGVPTVAVVGTPAKGMLHASDGDRAFRRGSDGTLKAIAARVAPADGVVAAVSRSHRNEETNTFLQGLTVSGEKVGGSSLKFCLVAEGEADVYPRFGRTMEWDTAAGHAVLRAAGGRVCRVDDTDLGYGKPGFENPSFIAWGRKA
ncbi:MAG: 3'(2'),5'-bisphosphate nucleotidase [Rhodospirillaceae bacterium]|nr:3'(2'),5'-bisphosphate nucleotidase [Rhodospirillaceae bacterium]|tara:strand:- start:2962 stop:3717 length:756 start_codon:yes stop_codon:yes gene_type:complete